MVKLLRLPHQAVIAGFKGKVDFYVHHGIPCARSWPRSPSEPRSPAVQEQWAAFATASRLWLELSEEVQNAYISMASASGLSGRDYFTRSYLSGLYRYPLEET